MSGDGRHADAGRMDYVDDVDADARADMDRSHYPRSSVCGL